ncbi:MAG TPA: hypothetical protein VGD81_12825 [Opitutaceae bacterium]
MLRLFLAWFLLLVVAIANGALREATFGKRMSELRAHQLSTLIGAAGVGVLIWFVMRAWPPATARQALGVGVMWVGLTVAFECFMVVAMLRRPLADVLRDYNLWAGRVWLLFLLWLALAPWLFFRLQRAGTS